MKPVLQLDEIVYSRKTSIYSDIHLTFYKKMKYMEVSRGYSEKGENFGVG